MKRKINFVQSTAMFTCHYFLYSNWKHFGMQKNLAPPLFFFFFLRREEGQTFEWKLISNSTFSARGHAASAGQSLRTEKFNCAKAAGNRYLDRHRMAVQRSAGAAASFAEMTTANLPHRGRPIGHTNFKRSAKRSLTSRAKFSDDF